MDATVIRLVLKPCSDLRIARSLVIQDLGVRASVSLAKNVCFEFVVLNATRVVLVDDFEERVHVLALHGDLQLCDQVRHLVDCQEATLIQIEIVEDLLQKCGI